MGSLVIKKEMLENIEKITEGVYSQWVINTIIKTSFPTLQTIEQVIVAFQTAKEYWLDPKMKEMFSWIDYKGNLVNIASASWFMKIARRQPWFIKIEAHSVYKGEEFELNTGTGEVSHKISLEARAVNGANPIWAYARLEMEGKSPQVKFVNWNDYFIESTKPTQWYKKKSAMIEKCGLTVIVRQAFGLSGLYGEEEMDHTMSVTSDVNNEVDLGKVDNQIEKLEKEILSKNELSKKEKEEIKAKEAEIVS